MLDEFLRQLQVELAANRWVLIPRSKNLQSIAAHGLTLRDVYRAISHLSDKNYSKGPMPDRNGDPTPVWIFRKKIGGKQFYIKLKLDPQVGVKCISFHD